MTEFEILESVEKNWESFSNVKNPSEDLCLKALRIRPAVIKFIKNPTKKMQMIAVTQHAFCFEYIENPDLEVAMIAIKENGNYLEHIKEPTQEMIEEAIQSNPYSIQYVENQTENLCYKAIYTNSNCIDNIRKPTQKMWDTAISLDWHNLKKCPIEFMTKSVVKSAINQSGEALEYVKNQTAELCLMAVKKRKSSFRYVTICPNKTLEETLYNLKKLYVKETISEL